MGLLDDAIREHLDLKRRRGADPSEIAREEDEALGPVRRGEPAAEELEDVDGYDAYDEPAYDEPPAPQEPPSPAEPPRTEPEAYAEPESETATPPHGDPLMHQPTREFSSHELDQALGQAREAEPTREAEHARADTGVEGEDEDVLEETPDFLQETPEHDRLWFEQKPPKDFDF
jgi:hypothetical protein